MIKRPSSSGSLQVLGPEEEAYTRKIPNKSKSSSLDKSEGDGASSKRTSSDNRPSSSSSSARHKSNISSRNDQPSSSSKNQSSGSVEGHNRKSKDSTVRQSEKNNNSDTVPSKEDTVMSHKKNFARSSSSGSHGNGLAAATGDASHKHQDSSRHGNQNSSGVLAGIEDFQERPLSGGRPSSGGMGRRAPPINRSVELNPIRAQTPNKRVELAAVRRKQDSVEELGEFSWEEHDKLAQASAQQYDAAASDDRNKSSDNGESTSEGAERGPVTSKQMSSNSQSKDIEDSDEFDTDLEDADEGSTEDDEPVKAPNELFMEFLDCMMEEDYTNAKKLCKMILLYEPDHPEASKFEALIEEKVALEDAKALETGSESGSDDDDDDDDEDDDEDEDDSSGSSSSEDDDDDDDEDDSKSKVSSNAES